jgi:aminoglycoside phosphotransferase (APT) family kinase protein
MVAVSSGQRYPVDENLVRRLIAAQFPHWEGLAVARWPSGGTVNAMFRLGDDLVARLPLEESSAEDVALEQKWLPRIAPRLPAPIPEVAGAGRAAEGYPWRWSVYRWLPGEHPRAGALRRPVQLAEDLAEFVTAMREITLPGAPTAHRGGPLATLDAETRAAIERLRAIQEENVDCDAAIAVWERALRTADWDGPPVWLHGRSAAGQPSGRRWQTFRGDRLRLPWGGRSGLRPVPGMESAARRGKRGLP